MAESGDTQKLTGPTINGQETTVWLFSTDQLRQSIFLPSMFNIINAAYATSERSRPELRMPIGDRLGSTEELLANLTHDPESFIIVVCVPDTPEVLGTASCRRYLGSPQDSDSPWVRRLPVEKDHIEWELKMMATSPDAQGQGLAGFMMQLAEKEIVRRVKATFPDISPGEPKDIRLVLSTTKEINGPFYARKGYTKDYEVYRGENFNFHIIFMHKVIGRLE